MIYLKTKHYSGLSFRHTRSFARYHTSGAEGWGSQRGCSPTQRWSGLPSARGHGPWPVWGQQASRGQDTPPQTRARICMAKPASPHTVVSFLMDVEKGDTVQEHKRLNVNCLCPSQKPLLQVTTGIILSPHSSTLSSAQRCELPSREGQGERSSRPLVLCPTSIFVCASAILGG